MKSSDTLLGCETTSPLSLRHPVGDIGDREWLSLHLWWWGVVFDLWIVVASIFSKSCFFQFFVEIVFCVVSVLGHMVDALASGADEGRGRPR